MTAEHTIFNGTIRGTRTELAYALFVLLFYRPADYIFGGWYKKLCILLVVLAVSFFIFKHFGQVLKSKVSTWCWVVFFFWCVIGATFINQAAGNPVTWNSAIYYFFSEIGIIFFTEVGLRQHPRLFFRSISLTGGAMCLLNCLCIAIFGYHGGMYPSLEALDGYVVSENYFLFSEDNASIFWTLPVIVCTWIYYYRFKRTRAIKIWSLAVSVLIVLGYIYLWSVMASVLSASVFILTVFSLKKQPKSALKSKRKWNSGLLVYNVSWILALLWNYLLVFVQIFIRFDSIIENVFQKKMTLSGRTDIWESALYYIAQSPISGYGTEDRDLNIVKITFNHCHNIVLEILYRGGAIGLILFLIVLVAIGLEIRKSQDRQMVVYLSMVIGIMLAAFSVDWAFYRYPYLIIFGLMSNIGRLSKPRSNRLQIPYGRSKSR